MEKDVQIILGDLGGDFCVYVDGELICQADKYYSIRLWDLQHILDAIDCDYEVRAR